ncbi:hypothetical protein CLV70_10332 [Pseudosporangium ferrugineum]|uniref:Uncharacterized protein n=1 Tax=Pseudosporangium ferrugineum TaxID=439699 RepID=A0A2T0SCK1_9ACTN|nr:hypothetical protein CLV70_10332 [Pseudosporangium ferrugineum]
MTSPPRRDPDQVPPATAHRRHWRSLWRRCTCGRPVPCALTAIRPGDSDQPPLGGFTVPDPRPVPPPGGTGTPTPHGWAPPAHPRPTPFPHGALPTFSPAHDEPYEPTTRDPRLRAGTPFFPPRRHPQPFPARHLHPSLPPHPATPYLPGQPARSRPPAQPARSQPPGRPATSLSPGRPVTAQSPGRPTTAQSPGRPTTAQSPGRPTTAQSPGRPASVYPPPGRLSSASAPSGRLWSVAPPTGRAGERSYSRLGASQDRQPRCASAPRTFPPAAMPAPKPPVARHIHANAECRAPRGHIPQPREPDEPDQPHEATRTSTDDEAHPASEGPRPDFPDAPSARGGTSATGTGWWKTTAIPSADALSRPLDAVQPSPPVENHPAKEQPAPEPSTVYRHARPAWAAPTMPLSQIGRAGGLTPAQAFRAGLGHT